jgi:hypothetical protein
MALNPKLLIAGAAIVFLISGKKSSNNPSSLTAKEKEEVEKVLSGEVPTKFIDYAGRIWEPCSEWFLGKNIPNWPPGIWPGQIQYLYKPIDVADWLGCIAGYMAHIDDLEKAIQVDFVNEAKTVETTRLVTLKRKQLQKYVACRLKALKRDNPKYSCEG